MSIRGIGGFRGFDYGHINYGAVAAVGAALIPVAPLMGAAICVGGMSAEFARFASNPRAYIDALYARRRIGAPSKPAAKKQLAEGTDSPNYAKRGASYIREKLGNGNALPSQSSVLNNIHGAPPKDEAAKRKYDGELATDKENDNILRAITEKIVGDWINDPKARGEFMRKWQSARTPAEQARALFDPRGDGSYMQMINSIVTGLGDIRDFDAYMKSWETVANWFANKLGGDVISSMGAEAASVVSSLGYGSSTPMSDPEKYIGKLTERGYSREEAAKIVSTFDSEEMADEAMRRMDRVDDGGQLNRAVNETIPGLVQKMNEASNPEIKRQYRDNIEKAWGEVKEAYRKRAERFLQDYTKVLASRFGLSNAELGYRPGELPAGVENVQTAVAWVQNRRGIPTQLGAGDGLPPAPDLGPVPQVPAEQPRSQNRPANGDIVRPRSIEIGENYTELTPPKKIRRKEYKYEIHGVDGTSYYCSEVNPAPSNCVDDRGRKINPVIKSDPAESARREKQRLILDRIKGNISTHLGPDGVPLDGSYNMVVNDLGDGISYNIDYVILDGKPSDINVNPPIE